MEEGRGEKQRPTGEKDRWRGEGPKEGMTARKQTQKRASGGGK